MMIYDKCWSWTLLVQILISVLNLISKIDCHSINDFQQLSLQQEEATSYNLGRWNNGTTGNSSGVFVRLTKSQKAKLDEFKGKVSNKLERDYEKDDAYLLRWLIAKNYIVEAAEEMLLTNLRWRKEKSMDKVRDEDWTEFARDYPYSLDGVDKEGRPILTFNFGDWDVRKATASGKFEKLQRWVDKMFEDADTLIRKLQAEGKNVTQWYYIANLEGYNTMTHGCLECLPIYQNNFVSTYQNNYPSCANKILIINSPQGFDLILGLIVPIFSYDTKERFTVYSNNKEEWKSVILQDVDHSQLKKEFGGTKA